MLRTSAIKVSSLASGSEQNVAPDALERAENSSIDRDVSIARRFLRQLLPFSAV